MVFELSKEIDSLKENIQEHNYEITTCKVKYNILLSYFSHIVENIKLRNELFLTLTLAGGLCKGQMSLNRVFFLESYLDESIFFSDYLRFHLGFFNGNQNFNKIS